MLIFIGGDHRGFKLKESIKAYLKSSGYEVVDVGSATYIDGDDYPDYAKLVAEKIQEDPENRRGVLVCGSGVGVDIVANKFARVRSVLAMSADHAIVSKSDDDTNIVCLAADFIDDSTAKKIVSAWLQAEFIPQEKYRRRLQKIEDIEWKNSLGKE